MDLIGQSPVPAKAPRQVRRTWIAFVIGVFVGAISLLGVAWWFGPSSDKTLHDPLTARVRSTRTWLGFTLRDRIEENEASRWADQHSIPGLYPGQYGWLPVTSCGNEWFSSTWIACGGWPAIPDQIYRGEISVEGLSREEALQRFQTELVAYYREHRSTYGVLERWRQMRQNSR